MSDLVWLRLSHVALCIVAAGGLGIAVIISNLRLIRQLGKAPASFRVSEVAVGNYFSWCRKAGFRPPEALPVSCSFRCKVSRFANHDDFFIIFVLSHTTFFVLSSELPGV